MAGSSHADVRKSLLSVHDYSNDDTNKFRSILVPNQTVSCCEISASLVTATYTIYSGDVPTNISIVAIPSKSPELNPQENVWQFIRDNWLSNRVFGPYDDIVDHCCDAWNKLVERPWRIMSLGLRAWAHEF